MAFIILLHFSPLGLFPVRLGTSLFPFLTFGRLDFLPFGTLGHILSILMLWFFFELATVVVGAILPMFRTWKVLKSRRSRQLIPLSKYWIVFASWVSLESVANVFSLPYFIPAYPFLKFTVVLYTSIFGYEQIYQKFVSPFLQEYEPNKDVLMASAQFYASRATQHALTYAWSTLTSHSTPRTKAIASTNVDQNHCEFPPVVKIVEFEEQEDFTELEEPEEPFDDLDAESDTEIVTDPQTL